MMTQSADASDELVGTWKLVSFNVEIEGSDGRGPMWGEHPEGVVMFTEEGRMLALLTAGDRIATAPVGELFENMCAYSGRYRVQGNRLKTMVDSAWNPAWIGTEQPRTFRRDGDILSLTTDFLEHPKFPGKRVRGALIWQKE